jgi:flagellar biosynthesis/type III secretory pathway M-ring protein FliF/YscJ
MKGEGSVTQIPDKTEQDSRIKNIFDESTKTVRDPAGSIDRVTIGVLIPVEVSADNREMGEAEKQLPKYKEWVLKVAGPQARDEDVSVQLIPSRRPEQLAGASAMERAMEWLSATWTAIAIFVLAFSGLLVIVRVVRAATVGGAVEKPGEITEAGRLQQGIKAMIGKNPAGVAGSLKAFMGGK